jgi:hypothetical protein
MMPRAKDMEMGHGEISVHWLMARTAAVMSWVKEWTWLIL